MKARFFPRFFFILSQLKIKVLFLFAFLSCFALPWLRAANSLKEVKEISIKEKYDAADINVLNSFFESDSAMKLPGAERVLTKMQSSALLAKDSTNWAFTTLNFGVYFYEKGKYEGSIHHLMEAIRYFEKNRNDTAIANAYNQLARVYYNINQIQRNDIKIDPSNLPQLALRQLDVDKGENFARQAAAINKRLNRKAELASNYNNLGLIKQEKFELDSAEEYFRKAIALYESLGQLTKKAYTLNNLGILYENLFRADLELNAYQEALSIFEKLGDQQRIAIANINIAMVHFDGGNNKLALEYANKSLAIANRLNDLPVKKDVYFQLSVIYDAMMDCDKELFFFQRFIQVKDSLFDIESKRILEDVNAQYETEKKENQISLLNKEKELDSIIRNSLIAGFALLLILAFVLLRSYRQKQSANLLLTSQNAVIESERKKSDDLLLNILPFETAQELKETGTSQARHFDSVTMIFTDFKGFTQLSEKLSPTDLVAEIDYCFKAFDEIADKYHIEKIKTIGDSYMAAGGLPIPRDGHAADSINAALEIRDFMRDLKQQREKEGKHFFEIRIGIHTGPVVAGIVGTKKFAYDVWGDTVNTASRMESSGEPGKVNISQATFEIVKDKFSFEARGMIQAKNKGPVNMYFVERLA